MLLKALSQASKASSYCLAAGVLAAEIGLALSYLNMQAIYLPFAWFLLALGAIVYIQVKNENETPPAGTTLPAQPTGVKIQLNGNG
jgi:hypothetical protein